MFVNSSLVTLLIASGLFLGSTIYAESQTTKSQPTSGEAKVNLAQDQLITVSIRAIHATRQDDSDSKANQIKKPGGHVYDAAMRDIRGKLKKLKYENYELQSHQKKTVTINQKETFVLEDGNVLTFKTISKEKDKICLWINWKDGHGMNVLNTRLHFEGGETVITGANSSADSGLILAIDVH